MSTRIVGRLGAAAVVAVGLLLATAIPASAVSHNIDILAGSTIAIGTTTTTFGGHPTTNTCAPNSTSSSLIADLDSTGGGTVSASSTGYGDFRPSATTVFKTRLNIVSGTVTITTTTVTVALVVNAEFRTCASTSSVCQTTNVSVTLSGANDSGSVHPGVSSNFTLSGVSTNVGVNIGCNAVIRAAINGFAANVSLNLHVAT